MATLENIRYTSAGLDSKPKANMNDYFYMDVNDNFNFEILSYNLNKFRTINNL
jgi:hypothetical protein